MDFHISLEKPSAFPQFPQALLAVIYWIISTGRITP
jgi:hypothetical protein